MPEHQSCVFDVIPEPVAPLHEVAPYAPDQLAEALWDEHGWSLRFADVASLLIAIIAASALMAWYG
jgi:hypothetical protein